MMCAQKIVGTIMNIVIGSNSNFKATLGSQTYILVLRVFLGLRLHFCHVPATSHAGRTWGKGDILEVIEMFTFLNREGHKEIKPL